MYWQSLCEDMHCLRCRPERQGIRIFYESRNFCSSVNRVSVISICFSKPLRDMVHTKLQRFDIIPVCCRRNIWRFRRSWNRGGTPRWEYRERWWRWNRRRSWRWRWRKRKTRDGRKNWKEEETKDCFWRPVSFLWEVSKWLQLNLVYK